MSIETALRRRIDELEDANHILAEQNAMLRAVFVEPKTLTQIERALSPQQRRLLAVLMRNAAATRAQLTDALYFDRPDEAPSGVVQVQISKMRRRLKPFGVKIDSVWGEGGYSISKECKAKIRSLGQ